jgi:hypothetical protein
LVVMSELSALRRSLGARHEGACPTKRWPNSFSTPRFGPRFDMYLS